MKTILLSVIALALCACGSAPKKAQSHPINLDDLPEWRVDLNKSEHPELSKEERKYAVASWVYSAAADRTYHEPEHLCFPLDEEWIPISVDLENFNKLKKSGFFAEAWLRRSVNERKELIIAYRGTDGADDFLSGNFSFIRSPFTTSQFDSAIEFRDLVFQQALKKGIAFDYVVFVGHSLGGGLAQYAQDFTKNSRAFVFNASPNRGRLYSLFVPHKSEKFVTRLYEKGEVLEWPRWLLFDFDPYDNSNPGGPGMNTRWIQFYKDQKIKNHNMKDFSAALTKLAAAAGDSQAIEVIKYLKERRANPDQMVQSNCQPTQ